MPPNQTGRHRERKLDGSNIMDFFRELEERDMDLAPLHRFGDLMAQYGPDLMFRMIIDTLHEMGDLDMILDIAEPMAAHHYQQQWAREDRNIYKGRRGDPFAFDEASSLRRGDMAFYGADFSIAEMRAFLSMAPDKDDPAFMAALRAAEAHIDAKEFFEQRPVQDYRDSDLHKRSERKKRRVR